MAGININPALVTNAPGTFFTSSEGYVQGEALDNPAVRNQLQQGILAVAQQVPIWGGCGIQELLPPAGVADNVGSQIKLATSQANLTGFTVFDQSAAMYNTPQSPVPLAPGGDNVSKPGGFINFYRLGSKARIPVKLASAAVAGLLAQAINTAVYWDYTNQQLLGTPGGTAIAVKLIAIDSKQNSRTVSWDGTNATWVEGDYVAVIEI